MAKIRAIRNHDAAVPVDHPDGGTLHIYPFDAVRSAALQDGMNALRYKHDDNGALVIENGKPVEIEISIEDSTKGKIAAIAKRLVAKITNVVDVDDPYEVDEAGNPKVDAKGELVLKLLTITDPVAIASFLAETSNHLVEREVHVIEWREREVKKESILPSADGGEPTRIIETRTELVSEPVLEGGKAKTEKKEVPAAQLMSDWAFDQARLLVSSKEAEVKNCLPTPVSSSV